MEGVVTSGDRIGNYRTLRTLGEGGMGVVHLAADPEGRNVAIKVLRPQVAGDATARRRLAREVDAMRRVHSPHVAEILDADVTAEQPYIVTQYVPGRTLEEIVEESGPIHAAGLQRLGVGLAAALSAIHGAGITHRDLKPGNVMLVDGEPIVIDFGIAQAADQTRLTATGMVIGTPGYLAPEIIEGEDAGPPSDVHAWAGTVAYAATGRPPFGSGTFESIFYKIMQGKPDLSGVPEGLLPVVRSAMARHPAERPTAVNLVQLTRRIHLEATITDQTRVDEHYTRPDASTGGPGGSSPQSRHDSQAPENVPVDHARQFSMPVAPPPRETSAPNPGPSTPPPTPAPSPSPVSAPVPAQPKDFVGLLPPAAPPPVPPPAPGPHEQQPASYAPYQPQSGRQSGQQPVPYGPYNQQYNNRGTQGQELDPQRRDQPARTPDRDRPKPYGWFRVLSFLVLVALLGFANITPLLAVAVTVVGVLVLRMGDKAAKTMEGKQTRRGPRSGDALAAAVKAPLHLPGALLVTGLLAALASLAGVIVVAGLMFAKPDMQGNRAIAFACMAMIGLLCLAPGSGAPRRQMARMWGAFLPSQGAAAGAAAVVGVFAAVLVGLSQGGTPDTTPMDSVSQDLDNLRSDVRGFVADLPYI
ncbi:serine/threonine-protein kinase [Spirillospora sp. CA-294931]|uniref:serine/threonine-protein kinase n=1 Tax=Spirillospora sp. CA-294931 TaxID=3240042 RepID=UPI003D932414